MIISDNTGLLDKHINVAPLWAKYSFDKKGNTERGFLMFEDGQLYNRSGNSDAKNPWNNWGQIENEFIESVREELGSLDKIISKNKKPNPALDRSNIAIQYQYEGENKLAVISKDYNAPDGQYLKAINDLVNQALAHRNKSKKEK